MIKYPDIIIVLKHYKNDNYFLLVYKNIEKNNKKKYKKVLKAKAFIGRNGIAIDKKEGDGKTPSGVYNLGIVFGTHKRKNLNLNNDIKYIQIRDNLYWVDDVDSKYYNMLVKLELANCCKKDWKSAEHLSDYPNQYEYAIEIKTNNNNEKGKGSAIFLHCSNGEPTSGCIAISKTKMKKLFKIIRKDSIIIINK